MSSSSHKDTLERTNVRFSGLIKNANAVKNKKGFFVSDLTLFQIKEDQRDITVKPLSTTGMDPR